MSFDYSTDEVHGLSEKAIQAKKRLRDVNKVSMAVPLVALPVTLRAAVSRVELASSCLYYDANCQPGSDRGETEFASPAG